ITAAVVLGMQACLPSWDSDEHRTVSYGVPEQVRELEIEAHTGGIVVNAGDGEVHVTEEQNYRNEAPHTIHEVKDGVLRLTYDCTGCGVGYTVRVPSGTKVRIKQETGGVRLTGLAAEVDASVETGGVEATGLTSKNVRLSSQTGGVKADFAAAPDKVEATTSTGGVQVKVPSGEAYAVDARADSGGTDVSIPSQQGAAHRITARAETGGVTVSGV
ncbi:DUF4097 family beta strand repeat-containing protein, partial [Streptomyces sp. FH025]|uniref:DUF4097 family beta strand repeat-containing protein n=1 Tax=Streptomyces sp. FH025 TaxID=2815937 RepID=UPI001A9DA316